MQQTTTEAAVSNGEHFPLCQNLGKTDSRGRGHFTSSINNLPIGVACERLPAHVSPQYSLEENCGFLFCHIAKLPPFCTWPLGTQSRLKIVTSTMCTIDVRAMKNQWQNGHYFPYLRVDSFSFQSPNCIYYN